MLQSQHKLLFDILVEKEKESILLEEKQDKAKWCICNKPVVENDAFEQKLDFIIFGKNYDSMLVKAG